MSKLSFKIFCIEKYADYKGIQSNKVYTLFDEYDILKMLDEDYDILHGFGFEYICNEINNLLIEVTHDNTPMNFTPLQCHGTVRACNLKNIIELISETYNLSGDEALKNFYESYTGECFSDDDTGLYGQSALYIFSLYKAEKQ